MATRTTILDDEQIASFLALEEVHAAKKKIDSRTSGSVYFTVGMTDTIRSVLQESFGLALPSATAVPMRWIKGDIAPHVDVGAAAFDTTHLLYLSDSPGQLVVDGASYPITKGYAYSFPEASRHKTIHTGSEPRLLLGPMSEEGFAVGGGYIDGSGGTTVYIRQIEGTNQYSYNQVDWNDFTTPVFVRNIDITTGTFTVEFVSDMLFNSPADCFICDTTQIQFGSTELDASGSRPVITIDGVPDYPGLIENGTFDVSGYSTIRVLNLVVDVSNGSTLATDGGWLGQEYFGSGAIENYFVNCTSNGPISEYSGGIVGSYAGRNGPSNLNVIGCSSSGLVGKSAGGIAGRNAGSNGGEFYCDSSWTTGDIDVSGGGIVGSGAAFGIIRYCYSTGDISGGAGGICGSECAPDGGRALTIEYCYSEGDVAANAGGIIGANALNAYVRYCYSVGNMAATTSGGIFAAPNFGNYIVQNCYTVGTVTGGLGYIIGASGEIPPTCFSEASSNPPGGTWNEENANTALDVGGEGNPYVYYNNPSQPYELSNIGYTPYARENINLFGPPSLEQEFGASVRAGSSTAAALIPNKNYTLVPVPFFGGSIPSSITIAPNTGIISTTAETPTGFYGFAVRNNGSYYFSFYSLTVLEAGGTYIDGSGNTPVYIRQFEGDNEYSYNRVDWNSFTSPPIFRNTNTSSGMFIVEFDSDFNFTSTNDYFICESSHIQFGSTELDASGNRPVFTIDGVTDYPGLIQNGTFEVSGYSNIHVYNLFVDVSNESILANDGGWVGQEHFGMDASDNYIVNCSSTGFISNEGGGIVGQYAGSGTGANLTIVGCSSSGDIDNEAGGIAGQYAGINSGSITCESCWSTGFIGNEGGGITGEDTENATIRNCYSTGEIDSESGGICGQNCENSTIENCYSTGEIGTVAGGIVGNFADTVTVTNCYSTGPISSSGGGIVGNNSSSLTITHCYTVGTVTDGLGYIIGDSDEIPDTCFSEDASGTAGVWSSANADTALDISVAADAWIYFLGTNEPYELLYMGYSPYTIANIDLSQEYRPFPFLTKIFGSSVAAGNNTDSAIVPNKDYTILAVIGDNDPSSITIDSVTGVISTTAATVPGLYRILVRNTGSYNISIYVLTVEGGGGETYSCCDLPTFKAGPNTGYAEYTDLRAGNIMMESTPRKNLSYEQLMQIRKAQSSKR